MMKLTRHERSFLLILSVLLFAGSLVIYFRHSRPRTEITVTQDSLKEQLTLKEVEAALREKRRIDINAAKTEDLVAIPGIGPALASRIIEYRLSRGYFESENDLLNVEGIGPVKAEKIKEYIKIE